VVAKVEVECGRKMDQIQKTKFPKKCNGNKIKRTSTITRNIIYES